MLHNSATLVAFCNERFCDFVFAFCNERFDLATFAYLTLVNLCQNGAFYSKKCLLLKKNIGK